MTGVQRDVGDVRPEAPLDLGGGHDLDDRIPTRLDLTGAGQVRCPFFEGHFTVRHADGGAG